MTENNTNNEPQREPNVWLVVLQDNLILDEFSLSIVGKAVEFDGLRESDWLVMVNSTGDAIQVSRIYRIRETHENRDVYFDRTTPISSITLVDAGLSLPVSDPIDRITMGDLGTALPTFGIPTLNDVPLIEDETYVRELLQLAVADDLLGPAMGPNELIVDMGVCERYLVGKLAPREASRGGTEGLEGATAVEIIDEDPELEIKTGRHDTGAEFESTTGRPDAEADATDEIDNTSNQSLVPSSFGLTFCVDGGVDRIEVEARWGRYERVHEHEITKQRTNKETGEKEDVKARVWQRVPCGGRFVLPLEEESISPQMPDEENPEVLIQGIVRPKNESGDRLITLFMVNAQEMPPQNRDSAWLFQSEIFIRAVEGAPNSGIFKRRPLTMTEERDEERAALEMLYRQQVEFAVGHGVSVHAAHDDDPLAATELKTVVIPEHEVPVTETPGLDTSDREAMRRLVDEGNLDMQSLAEMSQDELIEVLALMVDDYQQWISEQRSRIGSSVEGHDEQARLALDRCDRILERLREGATVLASDSNAFKAFGFANRSMALQRTRSLYAQARRRGEDKSHSDLDVPKNRSWRPFQLAFLLLSIPALADPTHKDRTRPEEADADLLWFPTGGGKTEAYLGVAAFAMAIRRLQGDLGGYDSSRGLTVIMRYTLRLLTLQQFQRAASLLCAMESLRLEAEENGEDFLGQKPFTIGLWVGNRVTPGSTEESHRTIQAIRTGTAFTSRGSSPAQLTSCPWCGSEIKPGSNIDVDKNLLRTTIYCGDSLSRCQFSKGQSSERSHPGLPVIVVDEEIYHRPPSMMIATVDKFALMAWRGEARTLFGRVRTECERHGLLWPVASCTGNHQVDMRRGLARTTAREVSPIRPPDLIIQDEFHLISGPLGTMVGLYETAIDELSTWTLDDVSIKPKVVASTATVRKAQEQVLNVFLRQVCVFPPHGLEVEDNFFSVQRPVAEKPGRRYLGVCSPGSSRPAVLIRVYATFLTAAQALFDRFGPVADPYMTTVGYFNSLRELGGMRRLAEDDVQTRAYRVQMSLVDRPGLNQRSLNQFRELTSRVSSQEIPKHLDELELKFDAQFDTAADKFITPRVKDAPQAIDIVLATNMLSVGVDVNRLGLMVVNGQPKGTAEYIQATSRVGRQSPGLICTVLTWARPRDLSHYETFEHYHATFYKHVEAQSVTPFSPRAMDRGLTGTMISLMRHENESFNPNEGAGELDRPDKPDIVNAIKVLTDRAWRVRGTDTKDHAARSLSARADHWTKEAGVGGRTLAYEKRGRQAPRIVSLLKRPGISAWDDFTVPMSMREVEPGVRLIMDDHRMIDGPDWEPQPPPSSDDGDTP